jgi:hypothetical protein
VRHQRDARRDEFGAGHVDLDEAATVGPRDFINAKHVFEFHNFLIGNTDITWEKMMSRLVCFGPVTPLVPDSQIQLCDAEVYISKLFAAPIQLDSDRQYR